MRPSLLNAEFHLFEKGILAIFVAPFNFKSAVYIYVTKLNQTRILHIFILAFN